MKYILFLLSFMSTIFSMELPSTHNFLNTSDVSECDITDNLVNVSSISSHNVSALQTMQEIIQHSLSQKDQTLQEIQNTLSMLLNQFTMFTSHIEELKTIHKQEINDILREQKNDFQNFLKTFVTDQQESYTKKLDNTLEIQQTQFQHFLNVYLTTLINSKIEIATQPITQEIQKCFADHQQEKESKLQEQNNFQMILNNINNSLEKTPYTADTTSITSYATLVGLSIVTTFQSRSSTIAALGLPIITYLGAKQYYGYKYDQLVKVLKSLSSSSCPSLLLPQAQNLASRCFQGQPEYNTLYQAIMNLKADFIQNLIDR